MSPTLKRGVSVAIIAAACLLGVAGCRAAATMGAKPALDAYSQTDTTVTQVTNRRQADGSEAHLLSAFFGLDDALPRMSDRVACKGASGGDGMPVIFSDQVDIKTVEPGDFRITTASGAVGKVTCLTLGPANDPGEWRTVLLAGHYGGLDDEPATVEIVGNVLSLDGTVNFKGARVAVTPLPEGPRLIWAEIVPQAQWELGRPADQSPFGGGSHCPVGTLQVVRVTWAGGVTKPAGAADADDVERVLYQVTTVRPDGAEAKVAPFALGDLKDGDNNHLLCLDTTDRATAVSFPAGYLTDPREDLNPETSVAVTTRQPPGTP
ncbi:MAG: hypothetical protein K1X35_14145 [Caulobacteraceae bacterium]|nr:hypothetical protein [Caulobacteraceae bacterium]